ncbi:unnamed protein product [Ascophyllum nodosum]
MELMSERASDGKKYPLARMGVMKMNAGNDSVRKTAERVMSLFDEVI